MTKQSKAKILWLVVKEKLQVKITELKQGFTLIEISIVMVVIAFFAGAVLLGQDLIISAENRGVVSQMQKYEMAWNSFKMKYNCLPSDCADASNFLTGAVNGDGNGVVNVWSNWGTQESLQVWNQLATAGLIEGKYTAPSGGNIITLGTTNPITKINNSIGYNIYSSIAGGTRTDYSYSLQVGAFGTTNPTWHDFLWGAGINATRAYDIDLKIDNGDPTSGILTSTNPTEPSAINTNQTCRSGTAYKLDTRNTGCVMYYKFQK